MTFIDGLRLAVKQGVQTGKVLVFWNHNSRMFVAECFYPGATEGDLDNEFLFPYLWEPEMRAVDRACAATRELISHG